MMCLGSVCHVFTTSHRHNVLTKASQNFALSWKGNTTTNFVCHSFVQVVLGFIVFAQHLAGVRLNFSMKTFCCPFLELAGGYHRHRYTKMQFQWSSWVELLLNSLKRLPIGFLCKALLAGEHQAHIDFRVEILFKLCKGREIHFTPEIKHIINILDSSNSGTMKFQYFSRAVRCFFHISHIRNDVNSPDMRRLSPEHTDKSMARGKIKL